MIQVHRLNGELFLLNSDMIETVEVTPDTVVRLVNGRRYVVKESLDDITSATVDFRRRAGYSCVPFGIPPDAESPQ
ncbi:MAG: flagellar FlbD family protein [Synergistaceae bacterium]|jgi:flagellar protein FlbD|nr:flagellar FlbD family protein [Synergistaceae bacterium]